MTLITRGILHSQTTAVEKFKTNKKNNTNTARAGSVLEALWGKGFNNLFLYKIL